MKIKVTADGVPQRNNPPDTSALRGRHVQMKDADTCGVWSDSSYPIFAPSAAVSSGPQRNNRMRDVYQCAPNGYACGAVAIPPTVVTWDAATAERIAPSLNNPRDCDNMMVDAATPVVDAWDTTSPIPFPGLPTIPPAALPQDDLLGPDNPGHRGARDVLRHLQEGKTLSPAARAALRGALDAAEAPLKGRAKSDDAVRRILR